MASYLDPLTLNAPAVTDDPMGGHSQDTQSIPQAQVPRVPPDSLNPHLIPDGFSYNVRLKFLPYRGHPMQLRLLDAYRRQALLSGLWQPRWYPVPQDSRVAIAPGDTLYYEQRVAKGSILWGYSFAVLPSTGGPASSVADLRISLLDVCNQYEITAGAKSAKYTIGTAFRANFTSGSPSAGFPFVFSPLYKMSGDGLIAVTIVNTISTPVTGNRQCQLLLMFIEPGGLPH